jgi:predicted O-methyltransferase YrrM
VHLPTVARIVKKSIQHPARAVRTTLWALKQGLVDLEQERSKLFAFLRDAFDADPEKLLRELASSEFAAWTKARREALANFPGPYRFASMSEWDCEALYFLTRALKPRIAVETGVCYGASTSYILEALARNGAGTLYSIDLGNAADEPPSDFFVHPSHKKSWNLIIGDSKAQLPRLLARLGKIDLFHHDSLHTYEHMMWEYETALRHMDITGAISSDDVTMVLKATRPFQRSPFVEFSERHHRMWRTVGNLGVAVDGSLSAAHLRRQRIHGRSDGTTKQVSSKRFAPPRPGAQTIQASR